MAAGASRVLLRPGCRRCLCLIASFVAVGVALGFSYLLTENVILPAMPSASSAKPKPRYPPDTPLPPTGTVTQSSVALSWKQPNSTSAPILFYDVQIRTDSSANATQAYQGPELSHEITGLYGSIKYCFTVSATNSIGSSNYSKPWCTTTKPPSSPDVPQALLAKNTSFEWFELNWTAPYGHGAKITKYTLEAAGHILGIREPYKTVCTPAKAVCNVTKLHEGRKYSFRANAVNSAGTSDWSSEVEYHTDDRNAEVPGNVEAPTLVDAGANYLDVAWDLKNVRDGGAELLGVHLKVINASEMIAMLTFNTTARQARVSRLTATTTFCVEIAAFNSRGVGPWSGNKQSCFATSNAQPPAAPRLMPAPKYAGGSYLGLSWTVPDDGGAAIQSYELQRDDWWTDSSSFSVSYTAKSASMNVTTLMPTIHYKFRVRAKNVAGAGAWSEAVEYRTGQDGQCGNPSDVEVYRRTKTTMKPGIQKCLIQCIIKGEQCAVECISANVGLSAGCAQCWVIEGECTEKNCVKPCIRPSSSDCAKCSKEQCFPACVVCTGVPLFYFPP